VRYWIFALLAFLVVHPIPVYAAENLPEYAEYAVCITGSDPRAQTDPEHFQGAARGFAPAPGVVTNAIPHWHLQDIARDLEVPVADLVAELAADYNERGQCALLNFYRSDDAGGTHHNAYFPYAQGAGTKAIPIMSVNKAAEAIGDGNTEYLQQSVDQEMQRNHGLGSSGQTPSEQGKRRGEE
jgi:hypothetical protein